MSVFLILPILIPFLAAAASLVALRHIRIQRFFSLLGNFGLLGAGLWILSAVWRQGILVAQIGGWPAPFGISLVADMFAAIMVVLAGIIGSAVALYSLTAIDPHREAHGYHPLTLILLMGVCGAFLTGDLFNLYVWFEVMLIASFILLALGGERAQMEGAIKYVTLNLVSSALFLASIGILYGITGTLNLADLAVRLNQIERPGLVTTLAMVFFVAFGIKAAIFPLFFWLPASYHTPPVPVSALFAGLLTKVGVYALIRVFTLLFTQDVGYTHALILIISGFTMAVGVLGAVAQGEMRRILSFHIVSQIGYMIMGLGLFTPLALAGSVFYIIHHIIVKANLFLVSGVAYRMQRTYDLKKLGGLYTATPALSLCFLISALSLAGLPPLSGFFAKLSLVQAGLAVQQYAIVAVALLVGLLTLYSMSKIWMEAFWKPRAPEARPAPVPAAAAPAKSEGNPEGGHRLLLLPVAALALTTVTIGLGAEFFFRLALRAAEELLNPTAYIQAVLGGG